MTPRLLLATACITVLPWLVTAQTPAPAPTTLADLHAVYDAALAKINDAAKTERASLDGSYLDTLSKLSTVFQSKGELERMIKIEEERKAVTETGTVALASNPDLDALRKIYLEGRATADKKTAAKVVALDTAYHARLQTLETMLTKASKIDDALEVRKERQRIIAEIAAEGTVKAASISATPAPGDAKDPGGDPPLATSNPFKDLIWTEPMTIPPARYHVLKKIEIKIPKERNNGAPEIVFPKGTTLSAASEVEMFIGRSRIAARESEFIDLKMRGDLSSRATFQGCTLRNCTVGKGGGWFGGNFASKWKFDHCVIERSFIESFKVWDVGLSLQDSTVQNAVLPSLIWNDKENDTMILADWLQVRRTKFEHCKIPLSFLMITESCSFVDCTYLQDEPGITLTKPLTVHLYQDASTSRIKHLPPNLTLQEHRLSELPKT